MALTGVNSVKINTNENSKSTPKQQTVFEEVKASFSPTDNFKANLKKGIEPVIKGMGAGALTGAVTGVLAGTTAAAAIHLASGAALADLGIPVLMMAVNAASSGLIYGAVAGGVAAFATNDKTKGAIIGAKISGCASVATAVMAGGSPGAILLSGVIGSIIGAGIGYSSVAFATKK